MRVSSFYRSTMRGGRPRWTGAAHGCAAYGCAALVVVAALALPGAASATQWPGELSGRILDSFTRTPLGAVEVLVEPGSWRTSTDASGAFRLRGLEPGSYRISVRRLGYGRTYRDVEVQNGGVARVTVELTPVALELVGITATVAAAGGVVLSRAAIVGVQCPDGGGCPPRRSRHRDSGTNEGRPPECQFAGRQSGRCSRASRRHPTERPRHRRGRSLHRLGPESHTRDGSSRRAVRSVRTPGGSRSDLARIVRRLGSVECVHLGRVARGSSA